MEMSQIGFSTHRLDVSLTHIFFINIQKICICLLFFILALLFIFQDGILFGMVGAYDWDGGVLKEGVNGRIVPSREAFESEFPLELKNHAAYLGTSTLIYLWFFFLSLISNTTRNTKLVAGIEERHKKFPQHL